MMPLTLVITDTADGTGGSATIAGSAGGSANVVYYAPWTGSMMSAPWTLAGTRTGDGSVPLTIGVGYFVFMVVSDATVGPWAYKNFTDASNIDAVHYQYLVGVKARLDQLNMVGLDTT